MTLAVAYSYFDDDRNPERVHFDFELFTGDPMRNETHPYEDCDMLRISVNGEERLEALHRGGKYYPEMWTTSIPFEAGDPVKVRLSAMSGEAVMAVREWTVAYVLWTEGEEWTVETVTA